MEKFNKTQSRLEDIDLSGIPQRVIDEIHEHLNGIKFIQNLINPNRRYSKDMPKDKLGRIIPDITNPHILEDTDYFRPSALHFKKHGCYTLHTKNKHPDSQYRRFWREEKRRCLEGYVRESDGEWIPGYYYFYLNYAPILQSKKNLEAAKAIESLENLTGKVASDRVLDFPLFYDNDYLYFHYLERGRLLGLFAVVLKARGKGYSLKGSAIPCRNALLIHNSASFMMAHDSKYLGGDGLWNKTMTVLDHCAQHTPFPRLRYVNKQSEYEVKFGMQSKGSDDIKGMKTLIKGIAFQNDEGKARGIRGKVILWEEAGKFPKLKDAWGIAESSLIDGDEVFGTQIAFGTGGEKDSNFEALESFFRSPDTYNILALPGVYDLNSNPEEKTGFFVGDYMHRKGCIDKDGNSDVVKALVEITVEGYKKSLSTTDSFAVTRYRAEHPRTPIESMMIRQGSYFPVSDLLEIQKEIKIHYKKFVAKHITCDLNLKDGKVYHTINNKIPLRTHELRTSDDREGTVEIFKLPVTLSNGKVHDRRYIIGIDPIDHDFAVRGSLTSGFVFDLFTDEIVAEYTGRPSTAEKSHEIFRRLAIFYNAKVNYENANRSILKHFKLKNSTIYLEKTPEILVAKEIVKSTGSGNNLYGTPPTKAVNNLALEESAEWLSQDNPYPIIKVNEDTGEKETVFVRNMDKLRSLGLIDEAIRWNPDGNFDRISAFGMVMISRANRLLTLENDKKQRIKKKSSDPFLKSIFNDDRNRFIR